jgi:Exocyst complex component Sec10
MDSPSSPAVQSLAYCLRVQFVQIHTALTPHSLSGFWTALSMRLYDILVARLLKHYQVSQQGAAILQGDVDTLRSVSMLAGTQHDHWDLLRELITLYMIPPDSVKNMLVGPEGDISLGKGLFGRAGRDQCLAFLSRRVDYRFKQGAKLTRSGWAETLLNELGVSDPTDHGINIGLFAAERKH